MGRRFLLMWQAVQAQVLLVVVRMRQCHEQLIRAHES